MLEVLVLLRMATKKVVLILENLDSQCMTFKKNQRSPQNTESNKIISSGQT